MKKYLIILIALLLALTGCKKYVVKDDLTPRPTYQGNNQRTGEFDTKPVTKTPRIKWKFKTGEIPVIHRSYAKGYKNKGIDANPLVYKGVVYFGANDGYYRAVDAETGKLKWEFQVTPDDRMLDKMESSPAIDNQIIYFGGPKHFYAVNIKTGKLKWKYSTKHPCYTPVISDEVVYFNSNCLYALDKKSGKLIWKNKWSIPKYYQTNKSGYISTSTPSIAYGLVFTSDSERSVYAYDLESGKKVWSYKTGEGSEYNSIASPVTYKGMVYFMSRDGYLHAVDAITGKKKWKEGSPPGDIPVGDVVVNDFAVYSGNSVSGTSAFDLKTGADKWPILSSSSSGFSPAGIKYTIVKNSIYSLKTFRELVANNTISGKEIWNLELENVHAISTSLIVNNSVIYIGTNDGILYALE